MRRILPAALPLVALTLFLAGCGGGKGSGSSGNGVVVVNPIATTVNLNGSAQFTSSVSGIRTIAIATTNGAVRASNVVTITTTEAHGLAVGDTVTVLGVTNLGFTGVFTVASVPSTTTFTYAQTGFVDASSGGGTVTNSTVRWSVNDVDGGNAQFGMITSSGLYTAPTALPPALTATIASNGAVRSSNVITITTTAAHGFLQGQIITVSGVTDTSFNGLFIISSVPSPTTFLLAQTGTNATSGGGTVTSFAVKVKGVSVVDSNASATAIVNIRSGIAVTVSPFNASLGTGESFTFTATVTVPPGVSNAVTWSVNDIAGGNATIGMISSTGMYTAPATVPSPATVTVKAASTVDSTQFATASVTIVTAADPTLTAVTPTIVAQGAFLQDIYLTGTNFLATNTVRIDGVPFSANVTFINGTLLRLRVPSSVLQVPGTLMIDVQRQNGNTSGALPVTVEAERPALVGTTPDSAVQGDPTQTVNFDGGYYTNSITAQFGGQLRAPTLTNSRQLSLTLDSTDLTQAGLFSLTLQSSDLPGFLAGVNLAIQPSPATNPPSVTGTVAVGTLPSAVDINTATGIAVVVNRGSDNVSLIDLSTNLPLAGSPISLATGAAPTGVAVDNVRNLAVVANNGNNTISFIDLGTSAVTTIASPTPTGAGAPLKPVSVGVNPLTGLALVANESTNVATVIDMQTQAVLGTVSNVSTGPNPRVAIEPRLNWGLITPGGAGTLTIVDLGPGSVVATVQPGTNFRGIGINPEAERALLVDPGSATVLVFSVLDQTTRSLNLGAGGIGHVAAAANPLTDVAVAVNTSTNVATLIDLRTPAPLTTVPVGMGPRAVAIDPGTNVAVVANETDGTVTIINLGAIRAVHVTQISPTSTITSSSTPPSDVTLNVLGSGFDAGTTVFLDGTQLMPTSVSADGRSLSVTVPAAMLGTARRYALAAESSGGVRSNVTDFTVIQAVTVGTAPRGVAIDAQGNRVVVANFGSNNVSVVDLGTGMVTNVAVGTAPQGVAIFNHRVTNAMGQVTQITQRAVVTNSGSNNASIVDLDGGTVATTVPVGTTPLGVAVNPDTGLAAIANNGSDTVSIVDVEAGGVTSTVSVNQRPVAVAIDVSRNLAAVVHETANTALFITLGGTPAVSGTATSAIQLPTGVIYDPDSDRFVIAASTENNLVLVDPATRQVTRTRVGINPTSLAYNVNSSTLATVNTASDTISVMDFPQRRVRAILPLAGAARFSVEIHPRSNLAVISDEANNRILIVPLPR